MLEIYVDADACPVKDEIYRVAERCGMVVHVVSGQLLRVPQAPTIRLTVVGDAFDAADDWIAERIGPCDIAVTADIQLADRVLKAGAQAIDPRGKPFTANSIGSALATRALMQDLRAMGEVQGGPAGYSRRDRSAFLQALDRAVTQAQKEARSRPPPKA